MSVVCNAIFFIQVIFTDLSVMFQGRKIGLENLCFSLPKNLKSTNLILRIFTLQKFVLQFYIELIDK